MGLIKKNIGLFPNSLNCSPVITITITHARTHDLATVLTLNLPISSLEKRHLSLGTSVLLLFPWEEELGTTFTLFPERILIHPFLCRKPNLGHLFVGWKTDTPKYQLAALGFIAAAFVLGKYGVLLITKYIFVILSNGTKTLDYKNQGNYSKTTRE